jgi:hypothetical protein
MAATLWVDEQIDLRVTIPTSHAVLQGGFPFAGGWNPFVDALVHGRTTLESYYAGHRPQTLGEMYQLEEDGQTGLSCSPRLLPWLGTVRETAIGEMGLGPEHGISLYGPVTPQKLDLEWSRLTSTRDSISTHGYWPECFDGDINGQFLISGNTFRFLVRGGKHRAAALASLDESQMTVTFRPGWPRLIDVTNCHMWPPVVEGRVSPMVACSVFGRYFDGNCNRLADRLGLGTARDREK